MAPAIGHCAITWLLPPVSLRYMFRAAGWMLTAGLAALGTRGKDPRQREGLVLQRASHPRHPELAPTCNGLYPSNHFGEDFGGKGLFYFFVFAQFPCGAMLEKMIQPLLRLDHHGRREPFPKRLQIPLTVHLSILCPVERHHRTRHGMKHLGYVHP